MKKKGFIVLLLITLLFAISCNLDSGQGVYQRVFNDTPKNFAKILSVLGTDSSGRLILYANNDIYSYDGNEMKKECEITSYSMNGGYVPFMAADDHIFFSYVDESDIYKFFSATINEINNGLTEDFINSNSVEVKLPSNSNGEIILFNGLYNFDLKETQVTYTLDSDNPDLDDPNDKKTHYGYITKSNVSANSFTIEGGASVPSTAKIIGHRAVRVYQEDSDTEIGNTQLSDTNKLIILNENGTNIDHDIYLRTSSSVDYDDLVIGTDGEFFITLEGDLYKITGRNESTRAESDFASDLIYRANTTMPVFVADNGDKIGYLYEEGIYINPANRASEQNPTRVRITDDNDLVTSAWIGQSGNKFLMATQENGFWIVEITVNETGSYQNSSIHEYKPPTETDQGDGQLSDYIN